MHYSGTSGYKRVGVRTFGSRTTNLNLLVSRFTNCASQSPPPFLSQCLRYNHIGPGLDFDNATWTGSFETVIAVSFLWITHLNCFISLPIASAVTRIAEVFLGNLCANKFLCLFVFFWNSVAKESAAHDYLSALFMVSSSR